ncbi:MAG: hypothetical protein HOK28_16960 [Deltaproteobacteria bacterium]|nr:hypothetical protein [Deltaproteobacteria bacterium]
MKLLSPLIVLSVVVTSLFTGCSSEDTSPEETQTVDVTVRGPYNVGQQATEITYTPNGIAEPRTLRLIMWYPTNETRGTEPLWGESLIDAAPIPDAEFPVLVYSHGTSSFAECAYELMEYFASHGFVVASADHTGDTTANRDEPRNTEMYVQRPQDISAVIDTIYSLPATNPLAGRLTDDLALAGHSFGGWNVFSAVGGTFSEERIAECDGTAQSSLCTNMTDEYATILRQGFRDERVKVLIPMAPGNAPLMGPEGVSNITIPIMHMSATLDGNCPNETQGDPYWDNISAPNSMRVNYDKGGHHSYILTCEITPWIGDENGGGCGDEFTDYKILLEATNIYSLAFTRLHLFNDQDMLPILNGETSTFEDVTLSYK